MKSRRKQKKLVKKPGPFRPSTVDDTYTRIKAILEQARTAVARTVNTTQVVANWLVGREIVEEEQKGLKRAGYGKQLIEILSQKLSSEYGSGYSAQNLFYMKQFYLTYPRLLHSSEILHAVRGKSGSKQASKIHHAVSDESRSLLAIQPETLHAVSGKSTWKPGMLQTSLSWTHYRTLLRVETPEARAFYEVESTRNNWSARELERQINSLLFQRLAKSKDKKGLMRLATRGHEIVKAADVFKDPVIMEFLGLPQSPRMVE